MAIKAGQILHVANQFVVDRIQTGGPGSLNIPQERVYELGNYQTVGIVRDIPELSFSLDCLNVSTEVEALCTGSLTPTTDADNTMYDLGLFKPMDILSPWKSPYGGFNGVKGVVIPGLSLESASYRFGLQENAGEQFSLKGDAIYYVPGTPWQDIATGDGATTVYTLDNGPATVYTEAGNSIYALNVMVDGLRQTLGTDYTETASAVTFTTAPENGAVISIVYGSAVNGAYPQSGDSPFGATDNDPVHQGLSVKPAAIRGKDIDVYFSTLISHGGGITDAEITSSEIILTTASAHGLGIGDTVVVSGLGAPYDGTHTTIAGTTGTTVKITTAEGDIATASVTGLVKKAIEVRWPDVQSASVDWKVTLEDDLEFGNTRAVSRDFTDIPEVTGSVEVKPRSVDAFFTRIQQITGVDASEVIGPQSVVNGALRIELRNPEVGGSDAVAAGTTLKTLYVPDAKFTLPGFEGQVQQKLMVTLDFESDGGILEVYKGAMS